MSTAPTERRIEWRIAALFFVAVVASVALAVLYRRGGNPKLEGTLLAVALGSLGAGFVVWGNRLMPQGPVEEAREDLPTPDEDRAAFQEDFGRGGAMPRRKLLTRMLWLAGLALGAAFAFPIRSLGPGPGKTLQKTAWKKGLKLVDHHDKPLKVDDVPVGGLVTVFPEGHTDEADSQAVIIRLESEGLLKPQHGREDWSPEGLVVYSKIYPHAGCPVGLYQADTHQLLCPCHQSAFDVLDGAKPVFGPATRALPQLPIEVGEGGELHATGDFSEAVGPNSWNVP